MTTNESIKISGIRYDSRKVKTGDAFVAIKGYNTDGLMFAKTAEEKGAVCVVCESLPTETLGIPVVTVPDARLALAEMSHKFYNEPSKRLKLIGITGTNGKTTTTYLIKSILEAAGHKVGLIGTNQNLIGDKAVPSEHTTPESLELAELLNDMAVEGCTFAVMEVSSHSLTLNRVGYCDFAMCGFTNLTQDHLDFHGNMESYFRAKTKLFSMGSAVEGNCAIVNTDDKFGVELLKEIKTKKLTYGINSGDLCAKNISHSIGGVSFELDEKRISVPIPGQFTVYNALLAIGVCLELGVDFDVIADGLKNTKPVKGRAEPVPTGRDFSVIIDYAHTPDGLRNILTTIRQCAPGRITVLIGCGGDRDRGKRPKMGKLAGELADFCIITSDNPRTEEPSDIIRDVLKGMSNATAPYVIIENRRDAIEYALKSAKANDTVILAGKGHETYQILADATIHFDEREIVREALNTNSK